MTTAQLAPPSFLPDDLAEGRDRWVRNLSIAYGLKAREEGANYALFEQAQEELCSRIAKRYAKVHLHVAPWLGLAFWANLRRKLPAEDGEAHIRLLEALLTDLSKPIRGEYLCDLDRPFHGQFEYRQRHGGNVHLQAVGPTGMAKSSCLVGLGDTIKRVPDGKLLDRLAIDTSKLPEKFQGKEPGDFVMLDELLALVGEGSATFRSLLDNLNDTLRASGVHFFGASPELDQSATTQGQLQVVFWCPPVIEGPPEARKVTCPHCRTPYRAGSCRCGWQPWALFLLWVGRVPLGVIGLPWMPERLFAQYAPWKAHNVERTMKGQFRDTKFTAEVALNLCADARFVQYMTTLVNKPKLRDIRSGVEFFGGMMSSTQADRVAAFLQDVWQAFNRIEAFLPEWFGITPNAGMKSIAEKCYSE